MLRVVIQSGPATFDREVLEVLEWEDYQDRLYRNRLRTVQLAVSIHAYLRQDFVNFTVVRVQDSNVPWFDERSRCGLLSGDMVMFGLCDYAADGYHYWAWRNAGEQPFIDKCWTERNAPKLVTD